MPHRRFHQWMLSAAGAYNIAWGIYAAIDPQWLFRLSGMEPANHPQIFACLGMVIGLYGVLYLCVARTPETGWAIVAVGLTGKALGPIALAFLIVSGQWPISTVVLCLTNDLVWWLPFSRYLLDVHCSQRRAHNCDVQFGQRVAASGIVDRQ